MSRIDDLKLAVIEKIYPLRTEENSYDLMRAIESLGKDAGETLELAEEIRNAKRRSHGHSN